ICWSVVAAWAGCLVAAKAGRATAATRAPTAAKIAMERMGFTLDRGFAFRVMLSRARWGSSGGWVVAMSSAKRESSCASTLISGKRRLVSNSRFSGTYFTRHVVRTARGGDEPGRRPLRLSPTGFFAGDLIEVTG